MRFGTRFAAISALLLSAFAPSTQAAGVVGAGATTPAQVLQEWTKAYKAAGHGAVSYEGVGSGQGLTRLRARKLTFCLSDMPLSVAELNRDQLVQFPLLLGGLVPITNVKGIAPGQLRLSGPVLASIFLGKLASWDAPDIAALNPGLKLPAEPIRPRHRSDKSGASYVFTSYLSRVSDEWKAGPGNGLTVAWPGASTGCDGSDGLLACVQSTPGAIGYVDYGRATHPGIGWTQLKNRSGAMVSPSKQGFQWSAAAFPWDQAPAFSVVLVDQAGAESWPLSALVFVVMPHQPDDVPAAQAALQFFDWALARGGDAAERLGFVPLPNSVISTVKSAWRGQMKARDGTPVWRASN